MKKTAIILFLFFIGCQSYDVRFSPEKSYQEKGDPYHHSEVIYYPINGVKQKVKTLDFDKNNVFS